jgi:hypothetical protein
VALVENSASLHLFKGDLFSLLPAILTSRRCDVMGVHVMTRCGSSIYRPPKKLAPPGQYICWCIPMFGVYLFPVRWSKKITATGALSAPVRRAEGAPLLFSLYVTQEASIHQTWVCTNKSAALGGGRFLVVVVYICCSPNVHNYQE